MTNIPGLKISLLFSMSLFLTTTILLTGCSNQQATDNSQVALQPIAQFSAKQNEQVEIAKETSRELMERLQAELMKSLGEQGSGRSIGVCKTVAPAIATKLSANDVQIGRTSFRLRNPNNSPPEWAQSLVDSRTETAAFFELPNDGLGALLPIHLKSTCLLCHGNEQQIDGNVKAALASNYPNDQATGFAEGDLRGYFWVEVGAKAIKSTILKPNEENNGISN